MSQNRRRLADRIEVLVTKALGTRDADQLEEVIQDLREAPPGTCQASTRSGSVTRTVPRCLGPYGTPSSGWLAKHRLSNNVGGVKHFLSTQHALEEERHFALVEDVPYPTKARSQSVFRSGPQSDPCISSIATSTMIFSSNSSVRRSGVARESPFLQFPRFGIHKRNLLEARVVVASYNSPCSAPFSGPFGI